MSESNQEPVPPHHRSHSHSASTSPPNYAFLVHSQNTLRHTLPPDVDNESVARQKRRRTSPEDQAVLEAEFEKESKPDKVTRKAIAERVRGMGEKEVQIWFQNRRQNIRRRSRPLLPHEVPHLRAMEEQNSRASLFEMERVPSQSFQDQIGDDMHSKDSDITSNRQSSRESDDHISSQPSSSLHSSEDGKTLSISPEATSTCTVQANARPLKRSLSGKRLSMTSEGAAKLLADDESSPSPPRKQQTSNVIYRPSSSCGEANAGKDGVSPGLLRSGSGRSRDSRAWEFWCDTEARHELAKKAEQEQTGSAAAAIGLMRSSSRRALGLNASKANMSPRMSSTVAKFGKPSLERSKTSMARLETNNVYQFHLHEDNTHKQNATPLSSRFVQSPTGESDKENHDPHRAQPAPSRRRGLNEKPQPGSQFRRTALKASQTAPMREQGAQISTQTGRNRNRKDARPPNGVKEILNPEDDDEIARFMGGARYDSAVSLADEQDMDVVQGLLSLSKG